ncbi:MAG TPA: polyprenyl synthetase family protein [Lutibacter sp.]|nr:polyprenyl synthetase family protein [Lutibacter sp.]
MTLQDYTHLFLDFLQENSNNKEPKNLYKPVDYILQLGGKRLRPLLTLISADAFGTEAKKALHAALAVEVFHNFTLLHDDIMDQAPIRRGKPTVHEKWDINTGILSGDVMLINSYQYLEKYKAKTYKKLTAIFSQTAVEVCEGQQYDMDFETRNDVNLSQYMKMIKYKTSVLVAAALQMGAIIAKAAQKEQKEIYNFGISLGLAFQLQDDYLDSFGNVATFGKKIGGDILENKKTWLYIKALETASKSDQVILQSIYNQKAVSESDKIEKVKKLFKKYKIDKLIKKEIKSYSNKALLQLESMELKEKPKAILKDLVYSLEKRNT